MDLAEAADTLGAAPKAGRKAMRFFLYGTLDPRAESPMGRWIGERLVARVPATAAGRLVALRAATGWYPALLAGRGGERVTGVLAELRLAPGELALLDRYEGREYRRATVRVRDADGRFHAAQAWRWRARVPAGAVPIAGGDFLRWMERTGNHAFSAPRNGI